MDIGGNLTALLQVKDKGEKNKIGEYVHAWSDVTALTGWLDLSTGDSKYTSFSAKIQESTHIFICGFTSLKNLSPRWVWDPFSFIDGVIKLPNLSDKWKWSPFSFVSGNIAHYEDVENVDVTSDNARMVVDGKVYEILLIDDPMHMHEHLEIYLKYIGGQ